MSVKDERPWSNFYERLAVLQASEPEKQDNLGMQRKCEHDLILQIVSDAKPSAYVEIGSGNGVLLRKVKESNPSVRVVGFEVSPDPSHDFAKEGIELHIGDIFDGPRITFGFHETIKEIVASSLSSVVIYTDNGNKPAELEAVSSHLRVGDICGSHDYSGPDWAGFVSFLGKRNFAVMEQYEEYILSHLCLQRFWIKGTEFSGEPCRKIL